MARTINRLSPASLNSLAPGKLHADGDKLYLDVRADGARHWTFVFQWRGRRRQMGLGSLTAVPISAARKAAALARQQLAAGLNPIDERNAARRAGITFGEFADQYIADHEQTWKSAKHAAQWRFSAERDAKSLRSIPIAEVTTEDVLRVLRPIWATKPETAKRCQGRIERILDAAKARKLRAGENPAAWKGHLQTMLPKPKKLMRGHLAAMNLAALPAFMAGLAALPGMSSRALAFTILTAGRTSEVLGAKWAEIDFNGAVWTVPPERMKTGVAHRVPLSNDAISLLRELKRDAEIVTGKSVSPGDFVFVRQPSNERLSNMAMSMLMRRQKLGHLTVHGFRSTFRDWLGEHTTFPEEIGEMCLSHKVGSAVARAYRRGDSLERRREVMELWAAVAHGRCTPDDRLAA